MDLVACKERKEIKENWDSREKKEIKVRMLRMKLWS